MTFAALFACEKDTASFPGLPPDAGTSDVPAPAADAVADHPADTPVAPDGSLDQGVDQPHTPDTTTDQAPDSAAGPVCGDRRCLPDEFCRAYTFYPGVPGGPPPVAQYTCEPKPPACGTGPVTCACLPQILCTRPGCTCSEPPTQGHISCTCAAP